VTPRARTAPGLRRLAPEALPAKAQADRFHGLPEGLSLGQMLGVFKRAAASLGLAAVRDLVDQLMAFSQAQDWRNGCRPIVWPSNALLADRLGISVRHVRRLLGRLIESGIIVPVDSPEGRRWGRRDSSGRIVEAYGFDLSPLADRYEELAAVADRSEAERKARAGLRRRLTIARKAMQQLAETALEHGLRDRDWDAWRAEGRSIATTAAAEAGPLDGVEAAAVNLENRRAEAEAVLIEAMHGEESSAGDADVRPYTTTKQPRADESATRNTDSQESSGGGRGVCPGPTSVAPVKTPSATPRLVLGVSPPLQEEVFTAAPTWADVVDAADRIRQRLGISRAAWVEACQTLGRYQAATAVAVIAAKGESIRSPGGYLRGMIGRAQTGELHLSNSLWGLARRERPEGKTFLRQ
jgi:replication initiation protein RepC